MEPTDAETVEAVLGILECLGYTVESHWVLRAKKAGQCFVVVADGRSGDLLETATELLRLTRQPTSRSR